MSQMTNMRYAVFTGLIQDGKIFSQDYEGTQQIGVTTATHNELLKQHEELAKSYNVYQQMLIELGKIEVPLTPEEQLKKQAEKMDQMQDTLLQTQFALTQVTAQLSKLMGVSDEHNVIYSADSGSSISGESQNSGNSKRSSGKHDETGNGHTKLSNKRNKSV